MEMSVSENGNFILQRVDNPLILENMSGDRLYIAEHENRFEFYVKNLLYSIDLSNGAITRL